MRLGKRQIAFTAALGIAAAVTATGPASAAASKDSPLLSAAGGNAKYYANGDKVVVCDAKADGMVARTTLYVDGTNWAYDTASGAGKCTTTSRNLPEGTPVTIKLEIGPGKAAGYYVGEAHGVA